MSASISGAAPGSTHTGPFGISPTASACGKARLLYPPPGGQRDQPRDPLVRPCSASAWASHLSLWTAWNHIRTATSLATARCSPSACSSGPKRVEDKPSPRIQQLRIIGTQATLRSGEATRDG